MLVTVDMVVRSRLSTLLVQRKNDPYMGHWALPGGFLNEQEAPLDGALRELREETGLDPTEMERSTIFQIGAFGAPDRDPRGHVISIAYTLFVFKDHQVVAADDAASVGWFSPEELATMSLAFDHRKIIDRSIERIQDSFDGPHLVD